MEKLPIDKTAFPPPSPAGGGGERKIDREKLKRACTDFEALFVAGMLKSMHGTVPQTRLGMDPGREIYQGLVDQEFSRAISKRGSLNLGNMIYRQVLKGEERGSTAPAGQTLAPLAKTRVEDSSR